MALEQDWCDQELDYFDNVKLHKCAIRLGTSTTRITTDCTEGGECRSVYPCQNPCCAYRWPNLTLPSYRPPYLGDELIRLALSVDL